MQLNPHVFREYDIRGTVDQDLSPEFAKYLGRAYASLLRSMETSRQEKRAIAIGHDCRLSSPAYADALTEGINDGGFDVLHVGMGPTPMLYFTIFDKQCAGGIQVTGSHNPPDMNGFKLCIGTSTMSGQQIQELFARMQAEISKPSYSGPRGSRSNFDISGHYVANLIENAAPHMGPRKLKVVADAGNGMGGVLGPQVLRGLGIDVIELYCKPDGTFPNHHPDPTVLENLQELIVAVRENKADFGIGWDGDADRIGIVDQNGDVIFGDMLLLIYAREILKSEPGATIIGDVKCSERLFKDLKQRGANAIMWKTGHSLIKNRLRELGGALGGEMSGHIFFKHRFYGYDDAIYAAVRFAEIVSNYNSPVSDLLKDLPKMVATPEIRVDCPDHLKFAVVERAQDAFKEFKVDTTDGARITFPHGWGLVRASNTQPVLVLRFEAASAALLKDYQSLVEDRIAKIRAAV